MKRLSALLLAVIILLCGCGARQTTAANFNIIVASDLHYIAPTLTDGGAFFKKLIDSADGKLTMYSEEITDAFLSEVIAAKPEALILTGDVSFNGAVESHEALAKKLKTVEEAGIPVLVLPGNHDICCYSAARFSGDSYERVASAYPDDFQRIYAEFGYDEAISRDKDSLSYVYQLNDTTRIFMLDFNVPERPCAISDSTMDWIKKELLAAHRAGDYILTAGHQNIYQHTMFRGGYLVEGAEALRSFLEKYGVQLFFSGHMHIQHYMTENGLTEITTSALSVTPCHYGVVTAEAGRISYHTESTDVSRWAEAQCSKDSNLLHFGAFAADYFDARTRNQFASELYGGESVLMLEYLITVNQMFFSGNLENAEKLDPDGHLTELWAEQQPLMGSYLDSLRAEYGNNYNFFTLP